MHISDAKISIYSIRVLFITFIFFTLVSSYIAYFTGYFGGDLLPIRQGIDISYFYYLFFEYLLPLLIFYFVMYKINKYKISANLTPIFIHKNTINFIHYLFFMIVIFFLITVLFTNTGTMLRGGYNIRIIDLTYALIQPSYLIVIYIYFFKNSKHLFFRINIVIFLISIFLTGFTGHILWFLPFILDFILKKFKIMHLMMTIVLCILFLPILRMYKDMLKYGYDFTYLIHAIHVQYFVYFRGLIDRFNFVPNIEFINQNREYFSGLLLQPSYNPFYQGYIGSLFHKIIYHTQVESIHTQVQYLITGLRDSGATFPLISYINIDYLFGVLVCIYYLSLGIILLYIIKILSKNNFYFQYLIFLELFLLLIPGWLWSFMNFFQATLLFVGLLTIIKYLDSKKYKRRNNQCSKIKHY